MRTRIALHDQEKLRFRRGVIKQVAEHLGINFATARARVHRRNLEALSLAHDIEQRIIAEERAMAKKLKKNIIRTQSTA